MRYIQNRIVPLKDVLLGKYYYLFHKDVHRPEPHILQLVEVTSIDEKEVVVQKYDYNFFLDECLHKQLNVTFDPSFYIKNWYLV